MFFLTKSWRPDQVLRRLWQPAVALQRPGVPIFGTTDQIWLLGTRKAIEASAFCQRKESECSHFDALTR